VMFIAAHTSHGLDRRRSAFGEERNQLSKSDVGSTVRAIPRIGHRRASRNCHALGGAAPSANGPPRGLRGQCDEWASGQVRAVRV
jgi:hypothetical protein